MFYLHYCMNNMNSLMLNEFDVSTVLANRGVDQLPIHAAAIPCCVPQLCRMLLVIIYYLHLDLG